VLPHHPRYGQHWLEPAPQRDRGPRASSTSAYLSLLTMCSASNRLLGMTCPPEMRRIPEFCLVRIQGGRQRRVLQVRETMGGEAEAIETHSTAIFDLFARLPRRLATKS